MKLTERIKGLFRGEQGQESKEVRSPSSGQFATKKEPEAIISSTVTQQDKNTLPVGSLLDKTVVGSILSLAHNGDTRKLFALYEEMLQDPHIAAEYNKIRSLITQAPFELSPYPPSVLRRGHEDTEEFNRAQEIKTYVEDQLTDPDVNLTRAIEHLLWGLMTSVSGLEPIVQPKGYQGNKEKLLSLNLIPSTRYRYPNLDTELAIQTGDDPNFLTPVSDLGTSIITLEADSHIASPARRGVFRRLIPAWLIRRYSAEWWSRNVELFGVGTRVAKAATEEQRTLIKNELASSGSATAIVLPDGTEFDIKHMNVGSATPHQDILIWAAREISKNITGSTQTSEIQSGEGSKASAGTHMEIVLTFAEAYAVQICEVLREQLIKPMVARNFSEEDAELYCPIPSIRIRGYQDLNTIATALKTFKEAGFTKIPTSFIYEATGLPQPEDNEDTLESVAPASPLTSLPSSHSLPSSPSTVDPASTFSVSSKKLMELEMDNRELFLKATSKVTEPYRKLINDVEKEGGNLAHLANRVSFLARHESKTVDETKDIVNAVLLEALFRGIKDGK